MQLPGPTSPFGLRRVCEEISSVSAIARRATAEGRGSRENEPGARCPHKQRYRRFALAPLTPWEFAFSSSGKWNGVWRHAAKRIQPMKDRTNEEGIDPVTDAPAEDAGRRGMDESRDGGKHGAPQARTMIEEILDLENLSQAWKRVKANKGAPGIDGMTVEDFPAFKREEWPRIAVSSSPWALLRVKSTKRRGVAKAILRR